VNLWVSLRFHHIRIKDLNFALSGKSRCADHIMVIRINCSWTYCALNTWFINMRPYHLIIRLFSLYYCLYRFWIFDLYQFLGDSFRLCSILIFIFFYDKYIWLTVDVFKRIMSCSSLIERWYGYFFFMFDWIGLSWVLFTLLLTFWVNRLGERIFITILNLILLIKNRTVALSGLNLEYCILRVILWLIEHI
jgi:hypothetical protein